MMPLWNHGVAGMCASWVIQALQTLCSVRKCWSQLLVAVLGPNYSSARWNYNGLVRPSDLDATPFTSTCTVTPALALGSRDAPSITHSRGL